MADEEIGEPHLVLQFAHQVEDLRLHRDVERRGRLVADEELRLAGKSAGNRDALALAAGKLVRKLRAIRRRKADDAQQFADALHHLGV
ncbi:hypothetical protein D3C87_2034970 [compost metagenome]